MSTKINHPFETLYLRFARNKGYQVLLGLYIIGSLIPTGVVIYMMLTLGTMHEKTPNAVFSAVTILLPVILILSILKMGKNVHTHNMNIKMSPQGSANDQ